MSEHVASWLTAIEFILYAARSSCHGFLCGRDPIREEETKKASNEREYVRRRKLVNDTKKLSNREEEREETKCIERNKRNGPFKCILCNKKQ